MTQISSLVCLMGTWMALLFASSAPMSVSAVDDMVHYNVGVGAIYVAKSRDHERECTQYAGLVGEFIDEVFEDAGENDVSDYVVTATPRRLQERELINCNSFCNNYPAGQCYYWSQGRCSGRRMQGTIITHEGDEFPQAVHDLCGRRRTLLIWSLWEAALDRDVDPECRLFFKRRWEVSCVVTEMEA